MMNRIGNFLIVTIMFAVISLGEFSIQSQVNKTSMSPDEVVDFVLTLTGGGDIPNMNLPPLEDFDVVGTSRMSRISMINGAVNRSLELHFQLRPKKSGTLKIPSFRVEAQGKPYLTGAITVQVSSGVGGQQLAKNASTSPLFLEASTQKTRYYQGEPIIYSFRIYNQLRLFGEPTIRDPQFHNLNRGKDVIQRQDVKVVNGRQYQVNNVAMLLHSLSNGAASIDPVSMIFSLSPFEANREVRSNPVSLTIISVPQNVHYDQAIGQFKLEVSCSPQVLKANEAVTVKVTIRGQGNLNLAVAPQFRLPKDIDAYPPKSQLQQSFTEQGVNTTKTFELTWVPRSAGDYTIPSVLWTYFDPNVERFVLLSTPVIRLSIQKGPARTSMMAAPAIVTSESEDIRYLHTMGKDWKVEMIKWGWGMVFIGIVGLIIRFRRYRSFLMSWIGSLRPEARLSQRMKLLMSEPVRFYPSLLKVVSLILTKHYRVSPGELSAEGLRIKYPDAEWVKNWAIVESKSFQPNMEPSQEEMTAAIHDMIQFIKAVRRGTK